jgi:methylglutaconyl-CoA hydratase
LNDDVYESILVKGTETMTVTLNRPEVHNAFDERMISELTGVFEALGADDSVRVVVITGAGKSFSAGADLNWMRRMGSLSKEENVADAEELSEMFLALEEIAVPTIARVNGMALGGGAGLACACDFAVASADTKIGFSEVRLGLLPGVISPYVIERTGQKPAIRLFTTGRRMTAPEAEVVGLFDFVVASNDLDATIKGLVDDILAGGPSAVRECKALARSGARMGRDEFRRYCIEAIARLRSSPEGLEGVGAFLEKRKPNWRPDDED